MSPLTEVLTISGVALDLVSAAVLSHAHNAESIAEIRATIGAEESALGEEDAIATQAQLLAEKRIGFLILTAGISAHLLGLVLKSPEGLLPMGALGVAAAGLIFTMLWTRFVGRKVWDRRAKREGGEVELPEQ